MKKRIASLFMAFVMLFSLCVPAVLADTVEEEKLIDEVEEDRVARFTDVPADYTFYNDIYAVAGRGLFRGTTPTTFAPYRPMNRAMFVVVMSRLEGLEVEHVTTETGFRDVPSDYWAAGAIRWAVDAGIVTGYSDNSFHPAEAITRGQIAALVYRYITYKGYDQGEKRVKEVDPVPPQFPDVNQNTSHYAALNYCREHGLIRGFGDGTYRPYNDVTRAQVAAILNRIILIIEQIDGLSVTILPLTSSNPHGAVPTYKVTRVENGTEVNASVIHKGDKVTINHTPQNDNYYATVKLYRDADKKQPIGIKEVPITMAKDGNSSYFYMPDYSVWVEVTYERASSGGGGGGGSTYYNFTVAKVAVAASGSKVEATPRVALSTGDVNLTVNGSAQQFSAASKTFGSYRRGTEVSNVTVPAKITVGTTTYYYDDTDMFAAGGTYVPGPGGGSIGFTGSFSIYQATYSVYYAPAAATAPTVSLGGAPGGGSKGLSLVTFDGTIIPLENLENVGPGEMIRIDHEPDRDNGYHAVIAIQDAETGQWYTLTRDPISGEITLSGGSDDQQPLHLRTDTLDYSLFEMPDNNVNIQVWFEKDEEVKTTDATVLLTVSGPGTANLSYSRNGADAVSLIGDVTVGYNTTPTSQTDSGTIKNISENDTSLRLVVDTQPYASENGGIVYKVGSVKVNGVDAVSEGDGTYTYDITIADLFPDEGEAPRYDVVVTFEPDTVRSNAMVVLNLTGGAGEAWVNLGTNTEVIAPVVRTGESNNDSSTNIIRGIADTDNVVLTIGARGDDSGADTYWVDSVTVSKVVFDTDEVLSYRVLKNPKPRYDQYSDKDNVSTFTYTINGSELFNDDGTPKLDDETVGYRIEVVFAAYDYYFAAQFDKEIYDLINVPSSLAGTLENLKEIVDGFYVGKSLARSGRVPGRTPLVNVLMAYDENGTRKSTDEYETGRTVLNGLDGAENRSYLNSMVAMILNVLVTPDDGDTVKTIPISLPGGTLEEQLNSESTRNQIKNTIIGVIRQTVQSALNERMASVNSTVAGKKTELVGMISGSTARIEQLNTTMNNLRGNSLLTYGPTGTEYTFAGDWGAGIRQSDVQFSTADPGVENFSPFLSSQDATYTWENMNGEVIVDNIINGVTSMIEKNVFVPGIYAPTGSTEPEAFASYKAMNGAVIDKLTDDLLNAMLTNDDGSAADLRVQAELRRIDGQTKLEITLADVDGLRYAIGELPVGDLVVAMDLSGLANIPSKVYWRVNPTRIDALISASEASSSNSKGFDEYLKSLESQQALDENYADVQDTDTRKTAIKNGINADSADLRNIANNLSNLADTASPTAQIRGIASDIDGMVTELNTQTGNLNLDIDLSALDEAGDQLTTIPAVKTAVQNILDNLSEPEGKTGAVDKITEAGELAQAAKTPIVETADNIDAAMGDLNTASGVLNGTDGVIANLDAANSALDSNDWTTAIQKLGIVVDTLRGSTTSGQTLVNSLTAANDNIAPAIDNIKNAIPNALRAVKDKLSEAEGSIRSAIDAIGSSGQEGSAVKAIEDAIAEVNSKITEVATNKANAESAISTLTGSIEEMDNSAASLGQDPAVMFGENYATAKSRLAEAQSGLADLNKAQADLNDVKTELGNQRDNLIGEGGVKDKLTGVADDLHTTVSDLGTQISGISDYTKPGTALAQAKNLGDAEAGLRWIGNALSRDIPMIEALTNTGNRAEVDRLYKEQIDNTYRQPILYNGMTIWIVPEERAFGDTAPAINWNEEILRILEDQLPAQNITDPISVMDQLTEELDSRLAEAGFNDAPNLPGAKVMVYPVGTIKVVEENTSHEAGVVETSTIKTNIKNFLSGMNLSKMFLTQRFDNYEGKAFGALHKIFNEAAFPKANGVVKDFYNSSAYPGSDSPFIDVIEDENGDVVGADVYYESHPSGKSYDYEGGAKKSIRAADINMNKVIIFTGEDMFPEWHDIYDYAVYLGNRLRVAANEDMDNQGLPRVATWEGILVKMRSDNSGLPARVRSFINRFALQGNLEALAEVLAKDNPTAEDLYAALMPDTDLGDGSTGYYFEKSVVFDFNNQSAGTYRALLNGIIQSAVSLSGDEVTFTGYGTFGRVKKAGTN